MQTRCIIQYHKKPARPLNGILGNIFEKLLTWTSSLTISNIMLCKFLLGQFTSS